MEISPNVHWLDLGGSNAYLIVEPATVALVDTGMPKRHKKIFEYMANLGHQPEALRHILVTHADIDHVGSLAALHKASGAQIFAGPTSADLMAQGKSPRHMPVLVQWVLDTFVKYAALARDKITIIKDGETLPILGGLQVLATPGHTLDHFSFFSATSGVLFAGDALNTRNGRINLSPPRITADKTAARHAGIRLLQLSPAVIACGHGSPSTQHTSDDLMEVFNTLRQE